MSAQSSSSSKATTHTVSDAERKYVKHFKAMEHASDMYSVERRNLRKAKQLFAKVKQEADEHQRRVDRAMAVAAQAHTACAEALERYENALERTQKAFAKLPGDILKHAREVGGLPGSGEQE